MTVMSEHPGPLPLIVELLEEAERRNYSLGEVAQALDISVNTLGNWKRGLHEPRPRHRRAIIAWLRNDPATEPPPPDGFQP